MDAMDRLRGVLARADRVYIGRTSQPHRRVLEHYVDTGRSHLTILAATSSGNAASDEQALIAAACDGSTRCDNKARKLAGSYTAGKQALYVSWMPKAGKGDTWIDVASVYDGDESWHTGQTYRAAVSGVEARRIVGSKAERQRVYDQAREAHRSDAMRKRARANNPTPHGWKSPPSFADAEEGADDHYDPDWEFWAGELVSHLAELSDDFTWVYEARNEVLVGSDLDNPHDGPPEKALRTGTKLVEISWHRGTLTVVGLQVDNRGIAAVQWRDTINEDASAAVSEKVVARAETWLVGRARAAAKNPSWADISRGFATHGRRFGQAALVHGERAGKAAIVYGKRFGKAAEIHAERVGMAAYAGGKAAVGAYRAVVKDQKERASAKNPGGRVAKQLGLFDTGRASAKNPTPTIRSATRWAQQPSPVYTCNCGQRLAQKDRKAPVAGRAVWKCPGCRKTVGPNDVKQTGFEAARASAKNPHTAWEHWSSEVAEHLSEFRAGLDLDESYSGWHIGPRSAKPGDHTVTVSTVGGQMVLTGHIVGTGKAQWTESVKDGSSGSAADKAVARAEKWIGARAKAKNPCSCGGTCAKCARSLGPHWRAAHAHLNAETLAREATKAMAKIEARTHGREADRAAWRAANAHLSDAEIEAKIAAKWSKHREANAARAAAKNPDTAFVDRSDFVGKAEVDAFAKAQRAGKGHKACTSAANRAGAAAGAAWDRAAGRDTKPKAKAKTRRPKATASNPSCACGGKCAKCGRAKAKNPGKAAPDYSSVRTKIKAANSLAKQYDAAMTAAFAKYGDGDGREISGVGRSHFPSAVKDNLRTLVRRFHAAQDEVGAAWHNIHPRTDFYRSAKAASFRASMIRAGGYGTGA
jgi:hypothetical protein